MEGIRAGWNKAFWTIDYCCWNETQPRNKIMLLAGPWWWNRHFWGEESSPLLRQSGQHRFPSCSYDAIQKQHKKKKKKQSFADSCHHWKKNGAVGIKVRDRDYILLQKQNRRGWLEGKDSMIGWWLVHEGCMINGSTHLFSFFFKRKRNDNEGFDDTEMGHLL